MGKVLVIDDDASLRRACARLISSDGYEVVEAEDGPTGAAKLKASPFDTVITDLSLPGMSGTDVLRMIRGADPAVPIVVITGDPTVDSAAGAIEYGAYRYLPKPFDPARLRDAVRRAALNRPRADELRTVNEPTAMLEVRFERALAGVWLAVQPVVDVQTKRVVAYEALLRTTEPTLARPDELIRVAQTLGRFTELARRVRYEAAVHASHLPAGVMLFVNVHPSELLDDALFDDSDLTPFAERVVIEITERSSLAEVPGLRGRIDALRRKGFRIAIDDLGEGYAGLSAVAALEPDVVKLDMSLVRDCDGSETKRSVVHAMADLCRGLSRHLIAEGVETPAERATLSGSGVAWMQGYLFAKPSKTFVDPEI